MGSMNLYDFSQVNNDEMGFYVHKNSCPNIYKKIQDEAFRLCKNYPEKEYIKEKSVPISSEDSPQLQKCQSYSLDEMKTIFTFCDDYPAGIKSTTNGNIVLFWHTKCGKYNNFEKNDILYYQGQNTGSGDQKLIYGNKALHDCYTKTTGTIFLFKDGIFCGEQVICEPPFQKDGKWYFPLRIR